MIPAMNKAIIPTKPIPMPNTPIALLLSMADLSLSIALSLSIKGLEKHGLKDYCRALSSQFIPMHPKRRTNARRIDSIMILMSVCSHGKIFKRIYE
jgi:hypothetical protein